MKSIFTSVLILLSVNCYSQYEEGFFEYYIDVTATDTSLTAKQSAASLRNSKMSLFFDPTCSRVDYHMGDISLSSMIVNRETNKAITLVAGPNGNFAIVKKADELDYTKQETDSTVQIKYLGEFKKIIGYTCEKIIFTQNGINIVYWITKDFQLINAESVVNKNLPGFPMEFYKEENGIKMQFTISNLGFNLNSKELLFDTNPPENYTPMN